MFKTNENQFFESALFQTTGLQHTVREIQFVSGGSINNTVKVTTQHNVYFVKWNENAEEDLFEKEELGLSELRDAGAIPVPQVFGRGRVDLKNYLLLEYLQREAPKKSFWEDFGESLAHLHKNKSNQYGLAYDNHIGRLPQKNDRTDNWIDFFIENRLEIQLGLAIYNGHVDKKFANRFRLIYPQLPGILSQEPPSLLHGDLWSGNFMVGPGGKAHIFDPAVYYGNREIEISFTMLFGGYDPEFYQSYHHHYPLAEGFDERVDIYNLYPLMVHVNLFGTSYLSGVERTLRRFT